ncbi:MAG: glucose-1-phosphate adenylyltransferase [Vulcanimicrobiota bacterium]
MKTIAMILAGGEGSRLTVLSEQRAKPAVPFAGKFRIIDFTLSNCVNSAISTVGVLTQYRPHSLNEHIGIGKPWGLDRSRGGVRLLPPYHGRGQQRWFAGTADAIYQNLGFIHDHSADAVLILSGDHIYKMDYQAMIEAHRAAEADLTVAVMEVPIEEAFRFGIMKVEDNRIVEFHEKPKDKSKGNLASLGIYVFDTRALDEHLAAGIEKHADLDFGKHIIPAMIDSGARVIAHRFAGYWVDVGTIDSYWSTNLDLTRGTVDLDLYNDQWPVLTRSEERPAVKVGPTGRIVGSLVSNGCIVRGLVRNSVLSPGVHVSPGAVVEDSVVMNDTWVGPGARLNRVVIDKEVLIGPGAIVGTGDNGVPNAESPDKLSSGLTVIGKGALVPAGVSVGRNVLINSNRDESDYPENGIVPDGATI